MAGAAASGSVRPSIHDFDIIKPISRGSFGSVLLGRKKSTGDIYAIKVVKKSSLIEKNQMYSLPPSACCACVACRRVRWRVCVYHCLTRAFSVVRRDFIANERNILAFTDNPFVVKLYYSFQSANNLYMVMEFLPGGDCFSLLRNLVVFPEVPPHPIALFVFAVSCVALRALVSRNAPRRIWHDTTSQSWCTLSATYTPTASFIETSKYVSYKPPTSPASPRGRTSSQLTLIGTLITSLLSRTTC